MIVGSSYRIVPVDAFLEGLARVRRGVVLVRSAEGGLSTGFLITPRLVNREQTPVTDVHSGAKKFWMF